MGQVQDFYLDGAPTHVIVFLGKCTFIKCEGAELLEKYLMRLFGSRKVYARRQTVAPSFYPLADVRPLFLGSSLSVSAILFFNN